MELNNSDPILAVATPPGRGGVAVIRISSKKPDILDWFFSQQFFLFNLKKSGLLDIEPRKSYRVRLSDSLGNILDDGILLYFSAPSSYTGEHVLEFQGHGGTAVVQLVLNRLLEASKDFSLRLARPGEFTERAFLNQKIDLAQAEAVADLIDASTQEAARAAMRSLSGVFSERVDIVQQKLIEIRALVEAALDFPEEDIQFVRNYQIVQKTSDVLADVNLLVGDVTLGCRLREGLEVCLVGAPNVGKSSILNVLAGDEVAIVSEYAGTTRDRIRFCVDISGLAVTFVDTAGIRETEDPVEAIGVSKARQSLVESDLILFIFDASRGWTDEDQELLGMSYKDSSVILVANKCDLCPHDDLRVSGSSVVRISAKDKIGFNDLKVEMLKRVGYRVGDQPTFIARQRHVQALNLVLASCHVALDMLGKDYVMLELLAEELKSAHNALGEIVGRVLPDELLGVIFSKFCIGK